MKRSPSLPGIVMALAAVTSGCSENRVRNSNHFFRTFEEDGVIIAENRGEPLFAEELFSFTPVVTLQEDRRFESRLERPIQILVYERVIYTGEGNAQFGRSVHVGIDAGGCQCQPVHKIAAWHL